ncbi:MAG: hypothetical protein M1818_002168 [Claussenomyces sp. TS43310]|nr:MAG: hypothetical protein M1818_002168 [Claussenomyces sp. TS43310]
MPVLEFAIVPLRAPTTASSTRLLHSLHAAKHVQESSSQHAAYYLCDEAGEAAPQLYIVGTWPSAGYHTAFLPSAANQAVLASLCGMVRLEGIVMFHVDVDCCAGGGAGADDVDVDDGSVSFPALLSTLLFTAPLISVARFRLRRRDDFSAGARQRLLSLLRACTAPRPVVGGWRVEREGRAETAEGGGGRMEGMEEWLVLSGFESVEHHRAWTASPEFQRCRAGLEGCVEGGDVRLLRVLEV